MKTFFKIICLALITMFYEAQLMAQEMKWTQVDTISTTVIGGQIAPDAEGNRYSRMPDIMEKKVRNDVWYLSKQSAGEYIEFYSNSPKFVVEYEITEILNNYHFATTGVSGVDLYMKGKNGEWLWAPAKMDIQPKKIKSTFDHIDIRKGERYRLYLPLYNHVASLKIGIEANADIHFVTQKLDHPIVIYGTSIAQGACASRAGLAWTNMLGRRLDRDIVNLGFSGNGKLEKAVVDFFLQCPASLIAIDCMPNMSSYSKYTASQVYDSLLNVVQTIRQKTDVPILLVEHSGGMDSVYNINIVENQEYSSIQQPLNNAYRYLQSKGVKNIYKLNSAEFKFDNESTVDGIHPNDIGMRKITDAYEYAIRDILHLDKGTLSTNKPIQQFREYPSYDWMKRHQEVMAYNEAEKPELLIIGNSIMNFWAGNPVAPNVQSKASWDKYIAPFKPVNMGFGWDRTENILWRLENGELDGFKAKHVYIMAGTNNLSVNTDNEIVKGIQAILKQLKLRQPNAKVLLSGIFPRRDHENRISKLNLKIKSLAMAHHVKFVDFSHLFLLKTGKLNESLFLDGLHPNHKGYELLGKSLHALLK